MRWKVKIWHIFYFSIFTQHKSSSFSCSLSKWCQIFFLHLNLFSLQQKKLRFIKFIFNFSPLSIRCMWSVGCFAHWISTREIAMCTWGILSHSISKSTDTLWQTSPTLAIVEDCVVTGEKLIDLFCSKKLNFKTRNKFLYFIFLSSRSLSSCFSFA